MNKAARRTREAVREAKAAVLAVLIGERLSIRHGGY
ncbi:hypothetical protein J2X01_000238 [Arthrobacter ginsengisoli]|uniref:Uncharacterized protein n=1 Tax=Arthrobacter ginsengisoli TaxID=1356565 RepID=A0ABU1U702_9MICC|nr:hypothetical protein [Arthrobacter ginsengisoli]